MVISGNGCLLPIKNGWVEQHVECKVCEKRVFYIQSATKMSNDAEILSI
jgi:hypothetical protein